MYELLSDLAQRPAPFSRYTARELWTRPHLAQRMLATHLDPQSDRASRAPGTILATVDWIDAQVGLSGRRVCDLGCGPGLYAQRFAAKGAQVTGIDFSASSIDYAIDHDAQSVQYLTADYLEDELPAGFDLVTLIYCDLCVLSPEQRRHLLARIQSMLNPGGIFILDVANIPALAAREETTTIADRLMDGFWAPGDYVGIHRSFVYPEENLTLDRYLIVETDEAWQIFNWFQHYTRESIAVELEASGFIVHRIMGDLEGSPITRDSALIGIVAAVA